MKNIFTYIFCFLALSLQAQMSQKSKTGSFLIKNVSIVSFTNGTNIGDIFIQDGMIAEIGKDLGNSADQIIDGDGLFAYPGMIDGGTHIGLGEISAVSLTQDFNELGDFIPHMQALTAVNPNSVNIPVNRVAGVTTAMTYPVGGLFPGTAALINLHGYTPEQMYAGFKAPIMNFPASGKRGRRDRRSEDEIKKQSEKALKKLNDIWKKAKQYSKIDSTGKATNQNRNDYNPQMDALLGAVRGEDALIINVNKKGDILSALNWIKENEVKAILMGVAEGWRVAKEIAESKVPVIVGPVLDNPRRSSDKYDVNYANPSILSKAGALVCIRTNETENVRNLPYNAGFAATYGMGTEEALKAITINAAKIFGVDDKLGSLEKGKIANLFLSTGDPFETKTDIVHLFINGWQVPMESRHTLLYDEFLERDPGLNSK